MGTEVASQGASVPLLHYFSWLYSGLLECGVGIRSVEMRCWGFVQHIIVRREVPNVQNQAKLITEIRQRNRNDLVGDSIDTFKS
jgi:hypothetical protein